MREWGRAGVVMGARELARWRRAQSRVDGAAPTRAPRILLVRPDHLGDVLLSTPAIAALRAALPSAHLAALVGPWAAEVLAENPHLDAVQTADFPGFTRDARPLGWRAYQRMPREAERVRAGGYDAAVNLRPDFWWGAAMLALAGVPVRVGFDLAPGSRGLTHRVAPPGPGEHAARRSLRLARATALALGAGTALAENLDALGPEEAPLVFHLGVADQRWAGEWLMEHGLGGDGMGPILVHPGSGALVKLWPAELWGRAVAQLAAELKAPVVVAGSRAEAGLVDEVVRAVGGAARVLTLAEDMPLGRYAALLARARLVLGVDSGPLHLAVALGRPSVRLYGPTDPAVFGPWGDPGRHGAVVSHLPCAACGRLDYRPTELPAHPCMRLLPPAAVVAVARDVLTAAEGGRGAVIPGAQASIVENVVW